MKTGPIIIVDDDPDDHHIAKEVINELGLKNEVISFLSCKSALDFLKNHLDTKPFIILCDVNMPAMSGIDLKVAIESDEGLRKKSIPFVYLSTSGGGTTVARAYELLVQGFFVKRNTISDMKSTLTLIFDYWRECRHPNN